MINFVQPTEHDVHMYAKIGDLTFLWIFVINYSNIWIIGIFYEAIMHKLECGQTYCKYLLKRIPRKFTLYILDMCMNFYWFSKFGNNFCYLTIQKKDLNPSHSVGIPYGPKADTNGLAQKPKWPGGPVATSGTWVAVQPRPAARMARSGEVWRQSTSGDG
jgi:hypothetical protein